MTTPELADRIEAYAGRPDRLIQALQLVQRELGYVSEAMQQQVAETLGVTEARVHGVVTFYHLFRTQPTGRHTIRLCLGTACHVLGADRIAAALQEQLGIHIGQTTEDGLFSLQVVRCLGTCSLAPVMMVDEDVYGRLTPDKLPGLLAAYRHDEERSA